MIIENDNLGNVPWLYRLKIKVSAEHKFLKKINLFKIFIPLSMHAVLYVIS